MFNKIITFTALALIFSVNANAQEAAVLQEEPVSSDIMLQQKTVANKNEVMRDINRHIYNTNDSELREFVRNSNAMKRKMNPDAKVETIDVKNKASVSKFMQKEIGLPEKIVNTTPAETTSAKDYKSRASQDLK